MMSFLEKIRAFMCGRNGVDKLSCFTFLLYLLLNGIKMFFSWRFQAVYFTLWAIALAFLVFTFYRVLSKNLERRRYEESQFEELLVNIHFDDIMFKLKKKFRRMTVRIAQFKTHRFRTCPFCHEHLRLSKKRGKRNITCPKCGRKFKAYILF